MHPILLICVLMLGHGRQANANKSKPILYVHNVDADLLADIKEKALHNNFLLSFKEARQSFGNTSRNFLSGINIKNGAARLSSHFIKLAKEELGVEKLQAVVAGLPPPPPRRPDSTGIQEVKQLASHLQAKLHRYVGALWRTRGVIEEMFWQHLHDPMTTVTPCCSLDASQLTYSLKFGCPVNLNKTCDIAPNLMEPFAFNPGRNITSAFISNLQSHLSIKWQYFISKDGIHSEYPAHKFASERGCAGYDDTRHQQVYLSTVHPATKHVVLLLDVGGRPSQHQLRVARRAAGRLLSALRHSDRVSVLAVSDHVQRPASAACLKHGLFTASGEAKHFLTSFIENCQSSREPTNHTLGLEAALELLTRAPELRQPQGQALLVYLSRGVLSSVLEPQRAMTVMARYQSLINASVIVNAFGIASESQSSLERDFLEHITTQDFSWYNISLNKRLVAGRLFFINNTDQLSFQVASMFSVLNRTHETRPDFSLPYWDPVSRDLVVSVTQPCYHVDYFIGILGMDLHLPDLVEDLTYFSQRGGRYAFIVDNHGYTLMHPSFSRPLVEPQHPFHSDIGVVERRPGFARVRGRLLTASSGSETLRYTSWDRRGFNVSVRVLYTWQRVQDFPYTVCIAYPEGRRQSAPRAPAAPAPDLTYHRIDLGRSRKVKLCRHFRHMATMSAASLFLSATAFLSPYDHLTGFEPSYRVVQGYMAYLSDTTGLITSPGLKRGVRDDVAVISQVTGHWRRQRRGRDTAGNSRYIVRSFAATAAGVLVAYPGLPLDSWYEPTRRGWYLSALQQPGRVVLSSPYLDAGGAGYIVTLSQTVSLDGEDGSVAAVMGMDMTIGYFYQLLVSVLGGRCQAAGVTCFLLDDRGYMISHPAHVSPWRDAPVEKQHVSSQEPLLANHILSHSQFVSKKQCNRYTDNTVQRYYQLNTSTAAVVTSAGAGGEHCKQYQIAPVPGTNVFVGIVNQTCDNPAFCACSLFDRACLNCERMEAWECECPCECRLRTDLCTEAVLDQHPTCGAVPETVYGPRTDRDLSHLQDCVPVDCPARDNASDCVGVLGCEWCQLEADGHTRLTRPFCTDMERCFRGVLGAVSPYGGGRAGLSDGERLRALASPVGPVAGGIIAVFVALAVAVLCYRHHAAGRYRTSAPLALDDDEDELAELQLQPELPQPPPPPAGRLPVAARPAALSPYRLNPGYRRPPAGSESDHGYSTMTPHDDSEPPRAGSPASSLLSSPPPAAPPPPPAASEQTALAPHQIRAQAEVHAVL